MKKQLQFISLLLAFIFLVSSCGKGLYITKRKYTKGYYVNHSHKKERTKALASYKTAQTEHSENIYTTSGKAPAATSKNNAVLTADAITPGQVSASEKETAPAKKSTKLFTKKAQQIKLLESVLPRKKMPQDLRQKLSHDTEGALSLLWIIILVVLLVYLIALLFDSFGLGWLIHILALIALILLILWLLRVL